MSEGNDSTYVHVEEKENPDFKPSWVTSQYDPQWWGVNEAWNKMIFHATPHMQFRPRFAAALAMWMRKGRATASLLGSWSPTGYSKQHGWFAYTNISLGKEEDWDPYPSAEEAHTAYAIFEQMTILAAWNVPAAIAGPAALTAQANEDLRENIRWKRKDWPQFSPIKSYDRLSYAYLIAAHTLRFETLREGMNWLLSEGHVIADKARIGSDGMENPEEAATHVEDPGFKLWPFY